MRTQTLMPYLYCFWHVARLRSFTKAAGELNISQSSVSYQIKKLEQALGQQVIERDKGGDVRLNPAGERLAQECATIFLGLEHTIDALSGEAVSGELNVAGPSCFGSLLLTQALARLREVAPALKVHMHLSDEHIDLRSHHIDVAFRTMTQRRDLDTLPLLSTPMRMVASRSYVNRFGMPQSLEQLAEHPMILSSPEDADWRMLLEQKPEVSAHAYDFIYIDNVWGILKALEADIGISYVPDYAVRTDLDAGRLVEVMAETFADTHLTICLTSMTKVENDPRIRALLGALKDVLRDHPHQGTFDLVGPYWAHAVI